MPRIKGDVIRAMEKAAAAKKVAQLDEQMSTERHARKVAMAQFRMELEATNQ